MTETGKDVRRKPVRSGGGGRAGGPAFWVSWTKPWRFLRQTRTTCILLSTPSIPKESAAACWMKHCGIRSTSTVLNFLKILCEKGTLRELSGCARAYRVRYNQAHGILEATATTAVAMTEQQAKSLHEKLEKLTGKTIDLKTKVDPAVLGGIRLDIEGTELDGTVQNRLSALRRDIASVTL
mgnify:CR=1 FL=1